MTRVEPENNVRRRRLNPFKRPIQHPIEEHLEVAAFAMRNLNVTMFKENRGVVLELCEPQFQRIVAAAVSAAQFARMQQRPGGVLSSDHAPLLDATEFSQQATDGMTLLAQYAAAFYWDAPLWIRAQNQDS